MSSTLINSLPDWCNGYTSHYGNHECDHATCAIHRACEEGDVDIVDLLLDNGCDIGVHPVTGQSPLHAACAGGQIECAKLVLQVSS